MSSRSFGGGRHGFGRSRGGVASSVSGGGGGGRGVGGGVSGRVGGGFGVGGFGGGFSGGFVSSGFGRLAVSAPIRVPKPA
ncbi:MAG TPA: hypothetical protein PKA17_00790, partial [Phenylobacterium sp.]|nr:hypothetical protein [Phenylobacterium sp.]